MKSRMYRVVSKDYAYIGIKDFQSEDEAKKYAEKQKSDGFVVELRFKDEKSENSNDATKKEEVQHG